MSTVTTLQVRGMHCASCVSHVERGLKAVPGVSEALVNLATEEATVTHESATAPVSALVAAVQRAGYQAVVDQPPEGQSHPDHSHAHEHESERAAWPWRLMVGAILALPVVILGMTSMSATSAWVELAFATGVQVLLGYPFHVGAVRAAKHFRADMDTLVSLGTTVAYVYSAVVTIRHGFSPATPGHVMVYFDTVVVILVLIGLGKWLELRARRSAATAIRGLMNLQPPEASVIRDGREISLAVEQVVPGDVVLVRPGQRVPVDGRVTEGRSAIDQAMVTGESMPVEVGPGDAVIGGTLNQAGAFRFEATRTGKGMLLSQVVEMVKRAQGSKARIQRLADRVAGVFVPVVLLIATATLLGWGVFGVGQDHWVVAMVNTVAVLIVACPCALGLATPTAIMVGTGLGARHGILIKDAAALERAGKLTHVILDKTGTLTRGRPAVTDVILLEPSPLGRGQGEGISNWSGVADRKTQAVQEFPHPNPLPIVPISSGLGEGARKLLALAASVEQLSEHPLGRAIVTGAKEAALTLERAERFESITGGGVRGVVGAKTVMVEKPASLHESSISEIGPLRRGGKTVVVVSVDGRPVGLIALADQIKPEAAEAVAELHKLGLTTVLMTGDNEQTARAVAKAVGIDEVIAGALPGDKHDKVQELRRSGRVVAMVGDGINDAPALAAADIGIAMGGGEHESPVPASEPRVAKPVVSLMISGSPKPANRDPKPVTHSGTDIAMDAGHVVLVGGDLRALPRAIRLSRATMKRIHTGLFWAFAYNLVLIPIAASGHLDPMLAAGAMAFSSVSVVMNALWLRHSWRPNNI